MLKWARKKTVRRGLVAVLGLLALLLSTACFFPQQVLCVDSGEVQGDALVVLGGGSYATARPGGQLRSRALRTSRQQIHYRQCREGFARTRLADDTEGLALVEREAHITHRGRYPPSRGELDPEPFDGQNARHQSPQFR